MKDEKLKKFFLQNEVKIGKDYQSSQPVYYLSFYDAFERYFSTFRDVKKSMPFILLSDEMNRESLSWNLSSDNAVFTILSFHRFFELFIKDQLRKLNPMLAVKFPQNESEALIYIDGKADHEKIHSLEFSDAWKRLKKAFTYYNGRIEYDILKPIEFIQNNEHQKTLNVLAEWRNRIMHNGNTLMNVLALDYLVSQRVIPLVVDIAKAQSVEMDFEMPYFFQTYAGLNIIEEIKSIKFSYADFTNTYNRKKLRFDLFRLCHLKELGRASYNHNWMMRENTSYYETRYPDPLGRSERFAESEKEFLYFKSLKTCPCCTAKALVTYRQDFYDKVFNISRINQWARCYHCNYELDDDIGDLFTFNLASEPIFDAI